MDKITKDVLEFDDKELKLFDVIHAKKLKELQKRYNASELNMLEKLRMYQRITEIQGEKINQYESGIKSMWMSVFFMVVFGYICSRYPEPYFPVHLHNSYMGVSLVIAVSNLVWFGKAFYAFYNSLDEQNPMDSIEGYIMSEFLKHFEVPDEEEKNGEWVLLSDIHKTIGDPSFSLRFLSNVLTDNEIKSKRSNKGKVFFVKKIEVLEEVTKL